MNKLNLICISALALMVSGCCSSPNRNITVVDCRATHAPSRDADYISSAHNAICTLLKTARKPAGCEDAYDPCRPVIYSTTVDLNDYTSTTNFGRITAEALATALTQKSKSPVIKMTARQGTVPIIPRQGEFLLSRDIGELAMDFNAGAILASTYSVGLDKVYISVELINVDHQVVVGAVQYDIPLGPRTIAMLEGIEIPNPNTTFVNYGGARSSR